MSRRCLKVGAATVLAIALSGSVSAAAAEGGTATVTTEKEAWYVTLSSDSCESPADLDCSMLPAAEQYPKDTLHVGISAGEPTTATFLELDMFGAIPEGMDIAGGTLSLVVDTTQGDGSLAHESAKLQVCQVTDFFFDTKGSLAKPPKTDCDAASATASYVPDSETFSVDLAAFTSAWSSGESAALAVMPDPEAASGNETWHVAFWGKDNESDDAKPITAKVNYEPKAGEPALPAPEFEAPADMGVTTEPELVAPPPPADPVEAPETTAKPEVADKPEVTPEDPPEAVAAEGPSFRTFGYPYRIAWLMPLLLLIGFAVTGRALTKNLEPTPGAGLTW